MVLGFQHDFNLPALSLIRYNNPNWRSKPDPAAAGVVSCKCEYNTHSSSILSGRRAPAGTTAAKGRPHLGPLAMGNNASHSHNHIRIVPASDIEDPATLYDYDEYDDWVPTYQSSSFLHPAVGERQTQPAEEPQATTPKTFADMARRIRLGDHTCGSETSAQAPTPAPAPGIVRFQASRKGGESSWRPSRPSGPQAHSSEQDDSDHLVAQGVEQMQPHASRTRADSSIMSESDNHVRRIDPRVHRKASSSAEGKALPALPPLQTTTTSPRTPTLPNTFSPSVKRKPLPSSALSPTFPIPQIQHIPESSQGSGVRAIAPPSSNVLNQILTAPAE